MLTPATKMGLTFKITCTFFFSQILLPGRLARSYFNLDTVTFKLLIYQCLVVNLQLLLSYNTAQISVFLFLWITKNKDPWNNKLLSLYWKYLTMTYYGKWKCLDEIRRFDWIALIGEYWLVNNDWLADVK